MITRFSLKSTGVALVLAVMLLVALVLFLPEKQPLAAAQEPVQTVVDNPMPYAGPQIGTPVTSTIVETGPVITTTLAIGDGPHAFQRGDVFVAVSHGQVQWRRANGAMVQTLNTGVSSYTTGMALHPTTNNLYVTGFDGNRISVFNASGSLVGTFGSGYGFDPKSISSMLRETFTWARL